MKNIKTFKLFEAWEPKFSYEDVFAAIEWEDSFVDLYPGYSGKDADGEFYFDSKESAESHADSIIQQLDALPNPIPVYRAIKAKSEKDIDFEYPGESWSHDKESAYNFGRRNGSNFMLTAEINKEDVNWAGTIKAYELFSGNQTDDDENEIVIDDQDKLLNIKAVPMTLK